MDVNGKNDIDIANEKKMLLLHERNLIQSFYLIGVKNPTEDNKYFGVLAKYPNKEIPYLSVHDDIIISHCFPTECFLKDTKYEEEFYYFELPNINTACNQINSTIYFFCKIFNEEQENNYNTPKALVISSFYPFVNQFEEMLKEMVNYKVNKDFSSADLNQMIYGIPMPPPGIYGIKYEFLEKNKEIIFEQPSINKVPFSKLNTRRLLDFFTETEISELIKYILLEIPILIFCQKKRDLSDIIILLKHIISPFKIQCPVIYILPENYIKIIKNLDKFLIGVCMSREEFKMKSGLELRSYLTIDINENRERKCEFKISEPEEDFNYLLSNNFSKFQNDETSSKNFFNDVKDIENLAISNHYINKLENEYKKFRSDVTYKGKSNDELKKSFYYLFSVSIFIKYKDYLITDEKILKENYSNVLNGKFKITDLFRLNDFINSIKNSTPNEHIFFYKFSETEIFKKFIIQNLYPISIEDKMEIIFFDEMISEKNNKSLKQFKKAYTPLLTSCKFRIIKDNIILFKRKKIEDNSLKMSLIKKNFNLFVINDSTVSIDEKITKYYDEYYTKCNEILKEASNDEYYSKLNYNIRFYEKLYHNLENYIYKLWLKLFSITFWYVDYREKWSKFYELIRTITIIPKEYKYEILDKEISYNLLNVINNYGDKEMMSILFDHLIYKDYITFAYMISKFSKTTNIKEYYPKYSYNRKRNFCIVDNGNPAKAIIYLFAVCYSCKKKNDIKKIIHESSKNISQNSNSLYIRYKCQHCSFENKTTMISINNKNIELRSPFALYNDIKKINQLNVVQFHSEKEKNSQFYNVIIFFKLFGLNCDFVFPYFSDTGKKKYTPEELIECRDKSAEFSYENEKSAKIYFTPFELSENDDIYKLKRCYTEAGHNAFRKPKGELFKKISNNI